MFKVLGGLVILGLLLGFSIAVLASSEATFYSTYDGSLGCERSSYLEAHDSSEGIVYDSQVYFDVGQWIVGTDYSIMRASLSFDTSSIPRNAVIDSVELYLYGRGDHSDADFEVCVVSGENLSNPMVASNYHDLLEETRILGSMDTSGWDIYGYNIIGVRTSAVSKEGITVLALRSSRDINSVVPSEMEYVEFCMREWEGTDRDPLLIVTYTPPTTPASSSSQQGVGNLVGIIVGVLAAAVLVTFTVFRIRKRQLVQRR